jgi:hypothetical protein
MTTQIVDSNIFYRHKPEETEELDRAIIPLAEVIAVVGSPNDRGKMRRILRGKYFQAKDARRMRDMLLRACKYAKAHVGDYFPLMRQQILTNSLILERATQSYWIIFERMRKESEPVQ